MNKDSNHKCMHLYTHNKLAEWCKAAGQSLIFIMSTAMAPTVIVASWQHAGFCPSTYWANFHLRTHRPTDRPTSTLSLETREARHLGSPGSLDGWPSGQKLEGAIQQLLAARSYMLPAIGGLTLCWQDSGKAGLLKFPRLRWCRARLFVG